MSRKSNKFFDSESEVVEVPVVEVETITEPVSDPDAFDVVETVEPFEAIPPEVDPEQAEVERLNRVNDLEKQIIQHQELIKQLRSELKKLEGKTKREGPTKMESCLTLYNENAGLSRKEYVQMFQDKCGLTVAGARTYIQLIISKKK